MQLSCPYFLKHLIYKHTLGMQIHLKLVDPLAPAKCVPLGQKKNRGRPSKAKKGLSSAITVDDSFYVYFF